MDAVNYITTLDRIAPGTTEPQEYDFAILDLAGSDELLEQIYSGMTHERLQWWSLFEGTDWQETWARGPILVDLRNAANFRAQLLSQLESTPLGLVFSSKQPVEELRQHLTSWLCDHQARTGQLLRFYEPRMFAPLLCALTEQKRQSLLAPGSRWYWHDGYSWREASFIDASQSENGDGEHLLVTQQELRETEFFWLAVEARGYADHYAVVLASMESPECWVFDCLQAARNAGFQKTEHMERWLRLAIQRGADFPRSEPFRSTLSREDLTPTERLIAMESKPEKSHANA